MPFNWLCQVTRLVLTNKIVLYQNAMQKFFFDIGSFKEIFVVNLCYSHFEAFWLVVEKYSTNHGCSKPHCIENFVNGPTGSRPTLNGKWIALKGNPIINYTVSAFYRFATNISPHSPDQLGLDSGSAEVDLEGGRRQWGRHRRLLHLLLRSIMFV